MRDHLKQAFVTPQRHVDKAILIVVAVVVRPEFGGDAAPSARDAHNGGLELVLPVVLLQNILTMDVACYHQVHAILPDQPLPLILTPPWRKVCDYELPVHLVRDGLLQLGIKPALLVRPEGPEPTRAVKHRVRTGVGTASTCPRPAVLGSTDVMLRIPPRALPHIEDIAVDEKPVHVEIRVVHGRGPVDSRLEPPASPLG
mmetsp:Transcript_40434/g.75301  ORF Transcript_40434/g.75301 Transcript_40434/m.75301 type:complete len:200 (-) Transcript_40434:113-712(-)